MRRLSAVLCRRLSSASSSGVRRGGPKLTTTLSASSVGRPIDVFVVCVNRHLDAEEPISLANSVDGWRCVGCSRLNVRKPRARTLLGKGQIENLGEQMREAAAAGLIEDGSSVLPAIDAREWAAWKIDGGSDDGVSPLISRVPPAAATNSREWRASQMDGGLRLPLVDEDDVESEHEADELLFSDAESVEEATSTAARLLEEPDDDALDAFGWSGGSPLSASRGEFVVFIDVPSLRPSQQRNLQDAWGCAVYDRFSVVLNIFRSRARSKEALLRLELASLGFQKSRLVDSLAGFDQQRGGAATVSGAGEKAISTMRSKLGARAAKLTSRLAELAEKVDNLRRHGRERSGQGGRRMPVVALVGYTNAGKSLMHARLAGTDGDSSRARDVLFASLDTSTATARLADGSDCRVVDTVGFVRDLSHGLMHCFHATLQEALECDVVVLIIDASDPRAAAQRETVLQTLRDLKLPEELLGARVEVHNKCDKLSDDERRKWHEVHAAGAERPADAPLRRKRKRKLRASMPSADDSADAAVGADTVGDSAAARAVGGTRADNSGGSDPPSSPESESQPLMMLASARTGECMDDLSAAIAGRIAQRTGRTRRTLELPLGGALTGEQLSYLHGHPRVTVVDTTVNADGSRMLVTIEADESTYQAYQGQRWAAAD